MIEKANAKVNLMLDVIARREDGFHDLRSVMHSISLCDELKIDFEDSDTVEISLSSNVLEIVNDDNLVCRAARLYMNRGGVVGKVNVFLEKKIPIGAGLGGGSSDAAAVIRALNKHFGCFTDEALLQLCAQIGSDVAFCCFGGSAICEGRGEIITPIEFDKKIDFVIAIGDERVSTPTAYKELDNKFSNFDGSVEKQVGKNAPSLVYNDKGDALSLYNVFEEIIESKIASVSKIKSLLMENGAEVALMTGSGPAVFGIFADANTAKIAAEKLNTLGIAAFCSVSA